LEATSLASLEAPLVLAVVGRRGVGKTRVIEGLIKALKARGLRVSTAKHVPEEEFSLDRPGKDSWRHAEAGADAVTIVAPREVSTIRRLRGRALGFEDVVAWASEGCDILLLEGFKGLIGSRRDVPKVFVVGGADEASEVEAKGEIRPVLAFVGPEEGELRGLKAPYFSFSEIDKLAELILKRFKPEERAEVLLFFNGRKVPLNEFVRKVLRSLILAFASCLKGIEVRGDEKVRILVEER